MTKPVDTPVGGGRALRADARRNMERILDAAAQEFAANGLEAGVAEIAKRAGVGTGTIFRRFPTKTDLVSAVFEARLREVRDCATAAADDTDAMAGLRRFIEQVVELHAHDRGALECAGREVFDVEPIRELRHETMTLTAQMVARAQAAGDLRDDVVAEDIPVIVIALSHAATMTAPAGEDAWRRYLRLTLDGLRPGGTPLVIPPPDEEQLLRFAEHRCAR